MSVPAEYAWLTVLILVPIIIPFMIGLLLGVIAKRTVKLVMAVSALVIILVATGYVSLTVQDIYDKSMDALPGLFDSGQGLLDVIPYVSAALLIGLGIGLWKG